MHSFRVGLTFITICLSLRAGCSLPSLVTPVTSLRERPVVVATATPSAGKVVVASAHEQHEIAFVFTTGNDPADPSLDLDLAVRPVGVFIVVAAEIHNTDSAPLDLAATDLILADADGGRYTRVPAAELVLALLDTPSLSSRPLPPGSRAAGLVVFDVTPAYVPPLRLLAQVPGSETLSSAPFTPEAR
jgi:hypothetical protein